MRFDEILALFPDAKKSGDGWTAKCPAHLDGSPSLSISEGHDGRTLLHCHAGCTPQAICNARGLTLADLFAPRTSNIAPPAKPRIAATGETFNWQNCVTDFNEGDAQNLAAARGLSIELVRWIRTQGIVGIYEGKIAFANHGDGGAVVSAHVRLGGKPPWMFKPAGHKVAPLIFGDTKAAGFILAFESQWDAFAVMDKLGWHTSNGLPDTAVFITRGAANGKLIRGQIAPHAVCYAFKQNDAPTPEKPTPAGDEWLAEIASNAGCKVLNVATPAPHADANDWTRAGASEADLRAAMKAAMPVQSETAPVADFAARLATRIYSPHVKPPEPTPRFFLNGVQICTPGNLTTFFAQPKAGKTAALNAVVASTFAAPDADCFGFTSANPHGHAVLHFDTEQCQLDHWQGVRRLIIRAKVDDAPPWLLSYWLKGFTVAEIREAIALLLDDAKRKFGGIHSGIIDGVADAVNDVNDPAECNPFVALLEGYAVEYDCPILNVIHLNPGSTFKTRGHLGAQLERKSETNLQLEKDENEVTVIWSPNKNRHAPIPKNSAPRFAWSEEHQMHVSLQNIKGAKVDKERDELSELARAIFLDKPAMRRFELETAVKIKLAVKDKTAERRVTAMLGLGIVKKDPAGFYVLTI